jgi:hypothetical protein
MSLCELAERLGHDLRHSQLPGPDTSDLLVRFVQASEAHECPPLSRALRDVLHATTLESARRAVANLNTTIAESRLGAMQPDVPPIVLLRTRAEPFHQLAVVIASPPIRRVLVAILAAAHDLVPSYNPSSLRILADKRDNDGYLIVADDANFATLLAMGASPRLIAVVATGPVPPVGAGLSVSLASVESLVGLLDFTMPSEFKPT